MSYGVRSTRIWGKTKKQNAFKCLLIFHLFSLVKSFSFFFCQSLFSSLIHSIATRVIKLAAAKSSLALAPALVETYSRLLVYMEIESLGIKGFISEENGISWAWGLGVLLLLLLLLLSLLVCV